MNCDTLIPGYCAVNCDPLILCCDALMCYLRQSLWTLNEMVIGFLICGEAGQQLEKS